MLLERVADVERGGGDDDLAPGGGRRRRVEGLPAEARPQVVHQAGEKHIAALAAAYAGAGVAVECVPFIDDMQGEFPRLDERRAGVAYRHGYFASNSKGDGKVLNISMGGCSFTTASNLVKGAIMRLELKMSNDAAPVIVA